jgi:hypothetical protein
MNYERKLDFPKNEVQSSHNFPPQQTFAQKNPGRAESAHFCKTRLALRAQTRSNSALCKSSAQKKSLRRAPRPFAYFCGLA